MAHFMGQENSQLPGTTILITAQKVFNYAEVSRCKCQAYYIVLTIIGHWFCGPEMGQRKRLILHDARTKASSIGPKGELR